ncbi:helicase-associated domain-containing protein, partial [Deinococcus sp.]|uniref:helicase-associated domain-containing protein n=1 Tax=Deinococcus sp. TaxID=47478 RepID=UPI0025B855EE
MSRAAGRAGKARQGSPQNTAPQNPGAAQNPPTTQKPAPPLDERKAEAFDESITRLPRAYQQRIAGRYLGEKVSSGARAAEVIGQVRSSPELLENLVAGLSVTERAALGEVQRCGGLMDGWDLHVFLRLRDLRGDPGSHKGSRGHLGDFSVPEFTGAATLWELLTSGLLLPEGLPNPWMQSYYSQFEPPGRLPSRVLGDPRLLHRLPPEPAPPITASLKEVPAATGQADLNLLRLLEVLRGVRLHPLSVTKSGTISRASLKNLARSVTAVDALETWVIVGLNLGLLIRVEDRVTVAAQAGAQFAQLEPEEVGAARLSVGAPSTYPENVGTPFSSVSVMRRLLAAVLRALPHATTQAEVTRLLRLVTPPEFLASRYGTPVKAGELDAWVAGALRGQLSAAGLARVSGEGPGAAVTPAHLLIPPAGSGPAWILQANFDLLVYPAHLTPAQRPLLAAAEAVRFDEQTASYRLTRQSVYAALESGLSLPDLLAGLQAGSATPLTPGVQRSLEDWAARRDRLTLHRAATLLEYPTPAERGAAHKKIGGT